MGGALSLVALDLAPIDPEVWSRDAEPVLLELRSAAEGRLSFRKRPAFCDEGFSPHAIIAGAQEGHEDLGVELACRLLRSAAAMPEEPGSQSRIDAAWQRNLRWRAAERDNRKQADALARIFGETIARSYIETFLFPAEA